MRKAESEMKQVIAEHVTHPAARKSVEALWEPISHDTKTLEKALKSRSVAEIYKIVTDVAEDMLTPSDARKFIRKLTEKLIN